nr:iron-containing redox enzyme family protein [Nostoc sp. ChiQUE02]MDZ8234392.1 iron-containing redox enzyme family protein [Nostoc sp. ChiQUE02]
MTLFDEIVEATKADHETFITKNPLFKIVLEGRMTKQHYAAYLRETYHLVRHTSRALSLAGARLSDEKRDLRNWFFEQVMEENGHDLFCIKDLKNIGEDPAKILNCVPMAGAWGLITQNYYMSTYGNPVGILGVATATEGLGATLGSTLADTLVKDYKVDNFAVTFLRSHGGFDVKHLEDARRAINELVSEPEDIRDIIHARRMTFRHYSQLFLDVASAVPEAKWGCDNNETKNDAEQNQIVMATISP